VVEKGACIHEETSMGSLRLVGSSKLQVSFAEYRLFYRALLQKRHIILRSLLIVATPHEKKIDVCFSRQLYRSLIYMLCCVCVFLCVFVCVCVCMGCVFVSVKRGL